MTGFSKATVAVIWDRDAGRCAWCGEPITGERGMDWSVHHREPRGMGGSETRHVNSPANGVLLHGSGTTGCHGEVESARKAALVSGFLVSKLGKDRPSAVLITHAVHGRCWLNDDGTVWTQRDAMEGVQF